MTRLAAPRKIRLGASACLLGRRVRYDGRDKLDPYLTDVLGRFVAWAAVCPEVECGLGVPRDPMRLVGGPGAPRMLTWKDDTDHAPRMDRWLRRRLRELGDDDLWGFVLKSRSPSCGAGSCPVYPPGGGRPRKGSGLFALAFMKRFPLVPVEESDRLARPEVREAFFDRVFSLKRYRDYLRLDGTRGGLVRFHTIHKMVLLAHSPQLYREMGRLVAALKKRPLGELRAAYGEMLAGALRRPATRGRHVNVLQHAAGFLKKRLAPAEKREVAGILAAFAAGRATLDVPRTLLLHYAEQYGQPYLTEQVYLNPDPLEAVVRSQTWAAGGFLFLCDASRR